MRYAVAALVSALVLGCQSCPRSQEKHGGGMVHNVSMPDQLMAKATQPASLPPGAKMAVLEGDPAKPGFFAARLWMPDGYKIPPHTHPNRERVTVLSGTLLLGTGDTLDASKAQVLPAGSYSSMSPGMHHFGVAKG